ncbi:hypothetical protein Cgig2_020252 [Carnegiea gigantea]|uniref:Uncharacterized protein n=1 Tax=Carnegiea gigantea TaxID=171969 RepID=A0A9Q1QSF2_9CARY|nr:hypothetical protein Cgig2_020252 [Carnegiea gigantea]
MEAWQNSVGEGIRGKVSACAQKLKAWSKQQFGNIKKKIRETEKKLKKAQKLPSSADCINLCKELVTKLDILHKEEESMAYLRAQANEFCDGDKNSTYFHHKANDRRRRNHIKGLENDTGEWKQKQEDIEQIITFYVLCNPDQIATALEVGDGKNIRVWEDPWVSPTSDISSPRPLCSPDLSLERLILLTSRMVGGRLVDSEDADLILSLSISSQLPHDTPTGGPVKTAYSRSKQPTGRGKLVIVPRASWELLGVLAELRGRHILEDEKCPCFLNERETLFHAIFDYERVQLAWKSTDLLDVVQEAPRTSMRQCLA